MRLHFGLWQWYGQEKVSKEFEVNWEKENNTWFTICHPGQNRKRIIWGLFLNIAMKSFAIFDEDMTQTIYENYLGILGVMEIKVASQPRAIWVIPLIEKEYSQ